MLPLRGSRAGLAVYFAYIAASAVVGEHYLFTRYSMYSSIFKEKSTVVFSAGGRPARLHDFTDFAVDASEIDSRRLGFDGNEYYSVSEMRGYIRNHASSAHGAGRVPVEIDLYRVRWDDAAMRLDTTRRTLCRGTARARS